MNLSKNKQSSPPPETNTELCIYCGKTTEIPKALPIGLRKYYIYGCGQLCEDCYKKIVLKVGERK